jgi:hypothetical protein
MSTEKLLFNWSDAWLLLAISLAGQPGPATLEKIIAAGDRINFAIFKPDELESGLVRLTEAGYITEKAGSFSLTDKVQSHLESFLANQRSMDKQLRDVQEMLGAAEAPDDQPCRNNLQYPGFSKTRYEEAVQSYQGYLR